METRKTIEVVAAVIVRDGKIFATQRGYGEFKGWWEFPGGKMEVGETPQQALHREILEEFDTDIEVGDFITTVDYDYPNFHLTMHCFLCIVISGNLTLLEHDDFKWLSREELNTVQWLPADIEVVGKIKKFKTLCP